MEEAATQRRLCIPWLVHVAVLAAAGGGIALLAPWLVPLLARSFAIFAAVSTLLFPLCRRRVLLFFANYVVAAGATLYLLWRG